LLNPKNYLMANHIENLNVLIVDDETEACENIRNILLQYIDPEINILGIANDTLEAEKQIRFLKPNAIFFDIEMPGENALQFLERIYPFNFEIIFVTAYDQFAIRAFKLNAVDYILKPVDIDELANAITKLKEKLKFKNYNENNEQQLKVIKQIANKEKQHKITLKALNHVEIVDFKDIYFIEGQGSYCKICFGKTNSDKEIIISNTLSDYEELLPMDMFYRIHKSYLINCMHIKEIFNENTCEVLIKNKNKLPVSRRRYSGFIDFLKTNDFLL